MAPGSRPGRASAGSPAALTGFVLYAFALACQPNTTLGDSARAKHELAKSAAAPRHAPPHESFSGAPLPVLLRTAQAAEDRPPQVASAQPPPRPQEPATDGAAQVYRVAFMGDSLTDTRSHGGGFIRYLSERCPKSQFDNFGKGGDMVNQMRRRFQAEVLASQDYSHVVVFGGVNDLYSDLTANRTNESIQRDLTQMYAWSREMGARVVAINVAPWGGFRRYFNARRGENTLRLNRWLATQVGVLTDSTIDAHTLLRCGNPHKLCPEYEKPFKDGLHFGPLGHERLGKALFEAIFSRCR